MSLRVAMYPRVATFSLRASLCFVLLAGAALPGQSRAQTPVPTGDDPANAGAPNSARRATRPRVPSGAAISPDGSTVAWSVREGTATTLHLTPVAGTDTARASKDQIIAPNGATDCANTAPVWSPDGSTLAFTSTCTGKTDEAGQEQIFLWSKADAKVRQLTHLKGNIQQAAWSPDGKSIAFLFVENATRSAGALDAMKPFAGVIGEDGIEIQTIAIIEAVKQGANLIDKLTVFPVRPQLHAFEFTWAPDSKHIAFVGAPAPGENNWWIAQLYTLAVPGRSGDSAHLDTPKSILDPTTVAGPLHGLQIAVPRYSPDGKQIAFIGGLMSDQGSTGGDVWMVNADGKTPPVDITPGIDGTPGYVGWVSDHTISFVEDRRGHTLFNAVNINDKKIVPGAPVDLGEVTLSGGPIKDAVVVSDRLGATKDRVAAFVMGSPSKAAEVYTLAGSGAPQQLTHLNDGSPRTSARIESVEWENDGFHVQGWLTYPTSYDPNRKTKYPLIVTVHGGPSASAFPRGAQFADAGYFEFQPNPRGSYGQGEAFVQANRKDFGYGDLRDILKGMDMLEAKYPIDKAREGLTGWSYGGFMTMFGVTQTTRFAAAVAGAGISDWLSYYGENSIDQWMTPFFGASVYDDAKVYEKSSAITYIKQAKTPTLVIVGDRDGECPAPQSFEFWHALRAQGVKTQLVIYPAEGHRFKDPAHIADRDARVLKWFAENMPGAGSRADDKR